MDVMFASGVVTGAGSALDVKKPGFKPSYVRLLNLTKKVQVDFVDTMAAATGQKTVDSGGGTTDISTISSGGVTLLADGFTIGTDVMDASDVIHYVCWG